MINDFEDIPLPCTQCELTSRHLNYMVSVALISSEEKIWYEINSYKFTENEARKHIHLLNEFMPIMGYHSIPQNVRECVEATRLRVERDNFQEWRWNKNK